jgi:O-antigen/teichoic acid export membrane protein
MSNVRLSYSGMISFVIMVISAFTGLAFTLIVTRQLSPEEFGLWTLIGSLVVYVIIFEPISSFWVTRQVARNEKASVTGIGTNSFFSGIALAIYMVIIFFFVNQTDVDYNILLLAGILIPIYYINRSLVSIVAGYKPQGTGYGTLVFEFIKIPSGLMLVYYGEMGIIGAILATAMGQTAQLVFYAYYVREKFKEKFSMLHFKNWIKLAWLPLVAGGHDKIRVLDVAIFTMITGSLTGLAFWGVGLALSNIVGYSKSISAGLYPKLLFSQKGEYIEIVLKRTLFFAIPLVGMAFIFAKPGLWVLNPLYIEGVVVVYVWIVLQFIYIFEELFDAVLNGIEKVDVGFGAKFKEYVKSRLITVPLIYTIGRSVYLGIISIIFVISLQTNMIEIETLIWWGIVGIIIDISIVTIFWKMIVKTLPFKWPIVGITKFVFATLIAGSVTYYFLENFLVYEKTIFIFLPSTIPYFLTYVTIYFSIMSIIDNDTRLFIKSIFQEIRQK